MTEADGGWATPRGASPGAWLAGAIFSTLCCCTPLGIVGIVYAALAMGARDRGDWARMDEHLAKARGWTIAAVGIGLVAGCVGFALQAADTGG
jgi:hypothetical protein